MDELINEIASIYETEKVSRFYQENILQIKSLEDTYITSRDFPKKFSKIEVETLRGLAIQLLKLLEEVISEKLI